MIALLHLLNKGKGKSIPDDRDHHDFLTIDCIENIGWIQLIHLVLNDDGIPGEEAHYGIPLSRRMHKGRRRQNRH